MKSITQLRKPKEEDEERYHPLEMRLITRMFRYAKPYAAKRNWLFVLTVTRAARPTSAA